MKSSTGNDLIVLELIIFLSVVVSVYMVSAAGDFNCTIIENQSCGFTDVIYLENDTGGYWNAHAQNVSVGTYDYVVCCNSNSSLSYACDEEIFLKLEPVADFEKCMNITISNAGSSTLTNFPAYINLTHDNDMMPDFMDIRFYSEACNNGGSSLDYEIENYTSSDRAHVWVRIPSIPIAGTTISVYYKNNTVVGSGENPTGVWDSNYAGVWHMTEVNATDSTSNQNNGTESGGVTLNSSGRIDGANEFDGNDDSITVSDDESLNFGNFTNFTIELWAKVSSVQSSNYPVILFKGGWGGNTQPGYNMYYNNLNGEIGLRTKYNDTGMEVTSRYNLSDNNLLDKWIHIGGRIDRGNQQELYVDSVLRDTDSLAAYPNRNITNDQDLAFGDYGSYEFNGTIDEFRISNTLRTADWINQSYQMVENQGSFVSFGGEESTGGFHVQRGDYSGPGIVYGLDVCLTTTPGYFNCTYVDDSCPSGRECFASMASSYPSDNNDTNAHIGPCQQYQRKICCRVSDDVSVTYENPTPTDGVRRTGNSVTINVSVTTDSGTSVDTCMLEWKVGGGSPSNETMGKVGTGSSVTCNITKSTNDGTDYTFKVYASDSNGYWGNESYRTFRENDVPDKVVLLSPSDGAHFTNRTPTLKWSEPNDDDGDSLTYFVNITCLKLGGGDCSSDDRYESTNDLNYTPASELLYFGDDNYYYNWSVKAYDGYENGTESDQWNFTIDTNVSISLNPDLVDFGADRPLSYEDNTTDDSPNPFVLQNDGNCMIDANISAIDSLWVSKPSPTDYFNYSVDWVSGEEGAFNWTGSTTSWTNVPLVNVTFIDSLNYTDTNDSAEIDLQIVVPSDEPAGAKSSNLIFTGWYIGES